MKHWRARDIKALLARLLVVSVALALLPVSQAVTARQSADISAQATQAVFYRNDFEGRVGSEWSRTSTDTTPVGNRRYLGQFGDQTVSLSLDQLPAHSLITVSFDLFIIRSWDGNQATTPGCENPCFVGPDIWELNVSDGPVLLRTSFSNVDSTPPVNYPQSFPGTLLGCDNAPHAGAAEVNTLGYTYNYGGDKDAGDAVYKFTFTFPHSAGALKLNFSGSRLQEITDESWGIDNLSITAPSTSPSQPSTDLSISAASGPNPTAPGTKLRDTIRISNPGSTTANDITFNQAVPTGTSFVFVAPSQGECSAPCRGNSGFINCRLGSIPPGESVTVTVETTVLTAAGSAIASTPTVTTSSPDSNAENNATTMATPVEGGAVVELSWQRPDSALGRPTNLQVGLASSAFSGAASLITTQSDLSPYQSCTLVGYNIYASEELLTFVSSDATRANVPVAPGGSSYRVTAVWRCGGFNEESARSNEVSAETSGIIISSVKIGSKLKIKGSGFTGSVDVFIDGIGFAKAAKVKAVTQIVQKGKLTDGRSISDLARPGRAVLITIRDSNGGLASFSAID